MINVSIVNTLHNSNDDGCRPAEHDDSVDRLGGGEETPAFIQNNFSVTQRGEGDHGKVKGLLEAINRVQSQIGNDPDQHLHHGDNEHQKDDSADPVDTCVFQSAPGTMPLHTERVICLNRIFFVNWICGNPAIVPLLE